LRSAIAGVLPSGVNVQLVNDRLLGTLFTRALLLDQPLNVKLIDETVDAVLAAFGVKKKPRRTAKSAATTSTKRGTKHRRNGDG
jgi:hypothetical protein